LYLKRKSEGFFRVYPNVKDMEDKKDIYVLGKTIQF